MGKQLICGAHVITPGHDLGVTDICIDGDRIAAVGANGVSGDGTIDAAGLIALPGFIDIHCLPR